MFKAIPVSPPNLNGCGRRAVMYNGPRGGRQVGRTNKRTLLFTEPVREKNTRDESLGEPPVGLVEDPKNRLLNFAHGAKSCSHER